MCCIKKNKNLHKKSLKNEANDNIWKEEKNRIESKFCGNLFKKSIVNVAPL